MTEGHWTATAVVDIGGERTKRWRHPSHAEPRLRAVPASETPVMVSVFARDAVLRAGIISQLRGRDDLTVLDDPSAVPGAVALIVADELDDEVIGALRAVRHSGFDRVVIVASRVPRVQAEAALRSGVRGLLRRCDALPQHLADVLHSAATDAETVATTGRSLREMLSPDDGGGAEQAATAASFGLTSRDVEVLRLVAEGESTAAIARRLAYSESTIKNTIHTIVRQLGARNRAHAVASAVRAHVI